MVVPLLIVGDIYIYIYKERERERETHTHTHTEQIGLTSVKLEVLQLFIFPDCDAGSRSFSTG